MIFFIILNNNRLQTGMRGAFGKPQGTCARVAIGQVLLSVRCRDNHSNHAQEALRRAKFKFPGRQKIIVSRKWYYDPPNHFCINFLYQITKQINWLLHASFRGFTKYTRADYLKWKSENRIIADGVNAKVSGSEYTLLLLCLYLFF